MSPAHPRRPERLAVLRPALPCGMRRGMGKTVEDVVTHLRSVIERAAKSCQVCGKQSPRTAPTCPACGEGSWAPLLDMVVRHNKEDLDGRIKAARDVTLLCLRQLRDAANENIGFTAFLDEEASPTTIAGRAADVFAKVFLTDPRVIGSDAPNIAIAFAICPNVSGTDAFLVGSVSTLPIGTMWPVRMVRLDGVSPGAVADITDALLAEVFYAEP